MRCMEHVKRLRSMEFFAVGERINIRSQRLPEHTEDIEIVTSGEVFYHIDGEKRRFGRGAIFWHQSGEFDIWETSDSQPYRCAVFTFEVTQPNRPGKILFWKHPEQLEQFLQEVFDLYQDPATDRDQLGAYIYATLLRQNFPTQPAEPRDYPLALNRALRHIHANWQRGISLDELCRVARVSYPHLFRLFREYCHTTPKHYIDDLRFTHVCNLLRCGSLDLKTIAEECHFPSTAAFCIAFRRRFGISPAAYHRSRALIEPVDVPNPKTLLDQ